MRRGFTLLELMVACLLLGMLVTVLTMVFNQSSIAWRTGMAGVVNLHYTRTSLGSYHEQYDNALPGLPSDGKIAYQTRSPWDRANGKFLKAAGTRAFESFSPAFQYNQAANGQSFAVQGPTGGGQGVSLFTVGVRSAGPDGIWETEDDVTTWPEVTE